MRYEDMTPLEWLEQLARNPEQVEAVRAVVEAAVANTDAVIAWRNFVYVATPETQRERDRVVARQTETRTALDEAVDAYRTARTKAKVADSMARVANSATLTLSS